MLVVQPNDQLGSSAAFTSHWFADEARSNCSLPSDAVRRSRCSSVTCALSFCSPSDWGRIRIVHKALQASDDNLLLESGITATSSLPSLGDAARNGLLHIVLAHIRRGESPNVRDAKQATCLRARRRRCEAEAAFVCGTMVLLTFRVYPVSARADWPERPLGPYGPVVH